MGQIQPRICFWKSSFIESVTPGHLPIVYSCLHATRAESSHCDRDLWFTKPKIFIVWHFTETVCQPLKQKNKTIEFNLARPRVVYQLYNSKQLHKYMMQESLRWETQPSVKKAIPKLIGTEQRNNIWNMKREASNRMSLKFPLTLLSRCFLCMCLTFFSPLMVNSRCSLPKISLYDRRYIYIYI